MELPVIQFIRERLSEADPEFETRPGTAFHEMFVKPQELMLQPLMNTMDQVLVAQSIRRILLEPDPDAFPEEDVDDLVSNLYVFRNTGSISSTTVRVYYAEPTDKEFPANTAEFSAEGGLSFFNSADVVITEEQMALQSEGNLFFVDIPVVAQVEGEAYNVEPGLITGFVNDTDAVRVTNLAAATGGLDRETNTELLIRAQNSIGVRDLETTKGINAILREKFPFIQALRSIGMGDPEMMRDIVYNTHVGGKTDVYIKTPSLTETFRDFVALDFDTTRQLSRQLRVQMARSATDPLLPAETGTPQIAANSAIVRENVVETSASIESVAVPPSGGIDLTGAEWLRLAIDDEAPVLIKISGATVSQTQRFEIINSINAALGLDIAAPSPGDKIRLTSPTVGATSKIEFLSPAPQTSAANALFGISSLPTTILGVAAEVYQANTDYIVDHVDGLIYQTTYPGSRPSGQPTITSGQTMIDTAGMPDGKITDLGGGDFVFDSSVSNKFLNLFAYVKVRVGDEVTIKTIAGMTTGTVLGTLPQTFIVTEVVSGSRLRLQNFSPTGDTLANEIEYEVKSNQVVVIDYKYHPISIDIGAQVLLADGLSRGIRPGRTNYTIPDTPFIDIVSIQEIDPESGETVADPLLPPRGYGAGGYGLGGYGVGASGDYEFKILRPVDRFSVFEDGLIVFKSDALSRSYRVTYRWVPELVAVHNLSRTDSERVTGADVLPKNFAPAFVDIEVGIRRDPTNLLTPTNEGLADLISAFVNEKAGTDGIQASDISKLLEDQGVDSVRTPFTMRATVLVTDGSTRILESQDILMFPEVTLPKETDNFLTKRIVHFYPGNISVVEVP